MCDDNLEKILVSAFQETEEDLEKEKEACATFVDACPDYYFDEDEDEEEYEEELFHIELNEWSLFSTSWAIINHYYTLLKNLKETDIPDSSVISVPQFTTLMQMLSDLRDIVEETISYTENYEAV